MTSTQTRHQIGAFGMAGGTSNKEQVRPGSKAITSGFGNGTNTWGAGIWGNTPIGSGLKAVGQDTTRAQNEPFAGNSSVDTVTGSRSLLPLSESDNPISRHTPWKSMDETSPGLVSAQTTRSRPSPDHRQKTPHRAPSNFAGTSMPDPSFYQKNPAISSISSRPSQRNFLDPTSQDFVSSDMLGSGSQQSYSRQNGSDDVPYSSRNGGFNNRESNLALPGRTAASGTISGYNSSVGSRNGSMPPSRSELDSSSRGRGDNQTLQHPRYGTNATASRFNSMANAPSFTLNTASSGQRLGVQHNPNNFEGLATQFDQLSIVTQQRKPSLASSQPSPNSIADNYSTLYAQDPRSLAHEQWGSETSESVDVQDQLSPVQTSIGLSRKNQSRAAFNAQYTHFPNDSDARLSHHSSLYSSTGTPPIIHQQNAITRSGFHGTSTQQAILLERGLQGLQQQQQGLMPQQGQMQLQNQIPLPYEINPQQFRMSGLNSYYPMAPAPHLLASSHIPRGPARDHDMAGHLRSPLLEEFRNNSKTNKRYELKDIYDHIVEFSGDQHGSRFIQQKLETANSDEKDQVFRELHLNARQLMTDVFGNYVIQKFFEHGNQTQKKMLANQMKNHVLTLSTQMYGCRVVQKALEHILTDQQASLIKELEHDVMRCVKDQNGNHVVQKAIERVPAEHIQFIFNAFHGKVGENATHPYGCRVIQRMLEHCEEPTRSGVLSELHTCASSLINDQYGNYVTQHVIEHGRAEDRGRIVDLIILNLVNYSKHKFASNVVEKSIEFGSMDERQRIVQTLTLTNERGESPVSTLIRDQYGNYVVQKLLTQLRGEEWTTFAEPVKIQVAILKRFSYGKQVHSVEKLLYGGQAPALPNSVLLPPAIDTSALPTPPLLHGDSQSPQSSSHPSTQANSIDAAIESRKSSSNAIPAFPPNPI